LAGCEPRRGFGEQMKCVRHQRPIAGVDDGSPFRSFVPTVLTRGCLSPPPLSLPLGHTTRMKKLSVIIAVTLFAVFAIADLVHDFMTNDPVHYFSEQPHQLLVVAVVAVVGGLVAFLFYRLSPHCQRRVKLVTMGSAASFVTVCGVYFGYQFLHLSVFGGYTLALAFLCVGTIAALLWFEFYQICRSRVL